MNVIDYLIGKKLYSMDLPFYALVTALYLKADSDNKIKLSMMYPLVVEEIKKRLNSELGLMEEENHYDMNQIDRIVKGYLD